MKPVFLVLVALLQNCCQQLASGLPDRSTSFIGYHEKKLSCVDRLSDCEDRAEGNGCIYNAFYMRQMCPQTCMANHCTSHGGLKVRHKGWATPQGTDDYRTLMATQYALPGLPGYTAPGVDQLTLSSMGVGTYLGPTDTMTDEAVITAILFSVSHGWNVIDTASNYRWGRAELAVGQALHALLAGDVASSFANLGATSDRTLQKRIARAARLADVTEPEVIQELNADAGLLTHKGVDVTRDMIFVSTKVGFTHPDLLDKLLKEGRLTSQDIVHGMHTLHPVYIKASLEQSLERMNLETVDLLYLHNAAEVQLPAVGRTMFMQRLKTAFETLEDLRKQRKIVRYGLASWECFRKPPGDRLYLSLQEIVTLAKQVGGKRHGFAAIQTPINLLKPESWLEPWQLLAGRGVSLMEAADALGVAVFASSPLGGGTVVNSSLAQHVDAVQEVSAQTTLPDKLLQLVRSTPQLTTMLVGHKSLQHVESNVRLSFKPMLTPRQFVNAQKSIAKSRRKALGRKNSGSRYSFV